MLQEIEARRGRIVGVVQGVGFRPFVARLAAELELAGEVVNHGGEVEIVIEGPAARLDAFIAKLSSEGPAAAVIESARWRPTTCASRQGFEIGASATGSAGAGVGPDLRICARCLAETRDPKDRRFAYGLNSCTACGPRYTIIGASPWDRPRSALAAFPPCPACAREYADAEGRRWHAEALACPRCGPRFRLEDRQGRRLCEIDESFAAAVELLSRGGILAMKGVGGFQLLCDARDEAAVARLRAGKDRPAKPLAIMVADASAAEALVELSGDERALLASAVGPILLLRRRASARPRLAESVAPGQPRLGLMLASTAAHAGLLAGVGGPLVATSGNVHGRPIATDNDEARAELRAIADGFLIHDRAILRRADDSIMQVVDGRPRVLRLGRGLAPTRVALPDGFASLPAMIGLGAQLQAAPILACEGRAVAGAHVGDLDEPRTRAALAEAVDDLAGLHRVVAPLLIADAHPDDPSARWAEGRGAVERVHHHHAHVAATLAEHGCDRALGVAWDGVGYGPDGRAWGGEFLAVDGGGARRVASLRPFPLPGGDAAARDGLRVLAGMLVAAQLDAPDLPEPDHGDLRRFMTLARRPRLSPPSSSVGRVFDAFAALLGLRRRSRYQAEAAQALQAAAGAIFDPEQAPYPFALRGPLIDWGPTLAATLDPEARARPALVAARLHATLIAMILAVREREAARRVALAGGCFANELLLAGASASLRERGVEVVSPERLPPGDGGLALGQLWLVGQRRLRSAQPGEELRR